MADDCHKSPALRHAFAVSAEDILLYKPAAKAWHPAPNIQNLKTMVLPQKSPLPEPFFPAG
jgi:hypothetical protein